MNKLGLFFIFLTTFAFADAYTKCVACHGANGEKSALGGKSLIINEMTKADIKTALLGYKNGSYGAAMKAIMKPQAMPLSNADIEFIANKIGK